MNVRPARKRGSGEREVGVGVVVVEGVVVGLVEEVDCRVSWGVGGC